MLRIVQQTNSAAAKGYYSTADYYTEGQELQGVWGGRGAELLGLMGLVKPEDFEALCDNLNPQTGERLTVKTQSNRTVGYDFNFHVPKSVSVAYALNGDERILTAFQSAVRLTMQEIETEAQTRVRQGNQNHDRTVGNLTWGEFVHTTSRPIDGLPDMHLHAHCFVFNAVYDETESQWKAGQFRNLKRDAPYYEAVFHARLAKQLSEIGYEIKRQGKHWELAGLSPQLLQKFSRRTQEIEALAAEKGITDPTQKSELGAKTRQSKSKQYSWSQLKALWKQQLTPSEQIELQQLLNPKQNLTSINTTTPQLAWDYAIEHVFERASVVPEKSILQTALQRGLGEVSVESVKSVLTNSDIISREREGRRWSTTQAVLQEERAVVEFAKQTRGTCRPLNPTWQPERTWLNADQRQALQQLLTSSDRVLLLQGRAGTGKTTLLQEFQAAVAAQGQTIHAFAPSANASRGVQRQQGFDSAETVARLLVDTKLQDSLKHGLIWVDEAGLLGTKALRQILQIAEEQQARVLFTGDATQHASVERGSPFKLLEEVGGLMPAKLETIMRQTGHYRDAVKLISDGQLSAGYQQLEQLGAIQEISDAHQREQQLARDYVDCLQQDQSCLVIAPTHAEGATVTGAIRAELTARKLLGTDSQTITRWEALPWTTAERSDVANYQPGDMLQLQQHVPGHRKGERIIIQDSVPSEILQHPSRFQVYRPQELELKRGDLLRITLGGETKDGHRLNNGSIYRFADWTKDGDLRLQNGWVIDRLWGHLQHGYCMTSHASQGQTVKQVFIAQSTQSWGATSREQFYVSASRGSEGIKIYTDSKAELADRIEQSSERLAAVELVDANKPLNPFKARSKIWSRLTRWRDNLLNMREQFKLAQPTQELQYATR